MKTANKLFSIREVVGPIVGGYWGHIPEGGQGNVRIVRNGDVLECGKISHKAPLRSLSEKEKSKAQLQVGDVVITMSGNVGRVAFVEDVADQAGIPFAASNFVKILRPERDRIHPKYFFHMLRSPMFISELKKHTRGVAIQNLSVKIFDQEIMPLPSLAEQERIALLFDRTESLKQKREQASEKTAEVAAAFFRQMFASGNWPTRPLSEVCTRVTVGFVGPMAHEYVSSGVPFLRGQNIKRGFLDLTSVFYVSEEFNLRLKKSALSGGDVVSVRTGKPGVSAVIPDSLAIANCADLIVMTCGSELNPAYLAEFLNQQLGDRDTIAGTTGIAQKHFNIGQARRLVVPVPPIELQNEFADVITKIQSLRARQEESGAHIEKVSHLLSSRLFALSS